MSYMRDRRKDMGLTLKEVAAAIGVTQVTISRYELGQRTPSVKMAKKIATLLKARWEDFYEEKGA